MAADAPELMRHHYQLLDAATSRLTLENQGIGAVELKLFFMKNSNSMNISIIRNMYVHFSIMGEIIVSVFHNLLNIN